MKSQLKAPAPEPPTQAFISRLAPLKPDLIRGAFLALLSVVIWCTIYNRWSPSHWGIPIAYLAEQEKSDVIGVFAGIKVAGDGHFLPLFPNNIPDLGAPFAGNWDDFPSTEKPLACMMGFFSKFIGIFAAANLGVMLASVLAALSFYTACRLLKASWVWSFAGALVFAFSRFVFAHGEHHVGVAYYWHIPLCLVVARWIFSKEGIGFRSGRFYFSLAVALITGIQHPYYTNLFAQFVLFGGLVQWWRRRDWRQWRVCLPAASVIGMAAAGFLAMNSNTFIYHMLHGPNPGSVVRPYKWMEMYGLKLVDMLVPPPDHRFPPFAAYGLRHYGDMTQANPGEIVLPPGELPPTGYIGILGIAILIWLAVVSLRSVMEKKPVPLETWMFLWIMLYSDIGGLNCLVGTWGFMLFRSTTRFSICVLCILLMYAVRRLSAVEFKNSAMVYVFAAAAVFLGLWDQMNPQVTQAELDRTAEAVASDRDFTLTMESHLPPGAMVFQYPVMEYPESPAPGIGAYDHFRPYIYSTHLRYSFGSDKGRPQEIWQQQVAQIKSITDLMSKLEEYGFSALYINCNVFRGGAEAMAREFQNAGRTEMIQSPKGDLLCVFLHPSPHPALPPVYGTH